MSKSDASYGQLISDEEDVRLDVQNQVLRYFDAEKHAWVVDPSSYKVLLGTAADNTQIVK